MLMNKKQCMNCCEILFCNAPKMRIIFCQIYFCHFSILRYICAGFLTKSQLQTLAQPLCDTSFKKSDPSSFYTAWSSMAGLIKRGLVLRNGCPAK